MSHILIFSSLWITLVLLASMLSYSVGVASSICEIIVGAIAAYLLNNYFNITLNPNEPWIQFIGTLGAIFLTFLAGTELHPKKLQECMQEVLVLGISSFIMPFLICTAICYYLLAWKLQTSVISGIALSTTSVSIIYSITLKLGLNSSNYGKKLLAICFITDFLTVLVLSFMFVKIDYKTCYFLLFIIFVCITLPKVFKLSFKLFGDGTGEFETKLLLFFLLGMGALAYWASLEAILPSYLIGVCLASTLTKHQELIKQLQATTFSLLTPFYFLSVGVLVSIPDITQAPFLILFLLLLKVTSKSFAIFPLSKIYGNTTYESIYSTLLMSTGLTFGSIAALFGLKHDLITIQQYSLIISVVLGSAIFPTLSAYLFFKVNKQKIALK